MKKKEGYCSFIGQGKKKEKLACYRVLLVKNGGKEMEMVSINYSKNVGRTTHKHNQIQYNYNY